MRARYFRDPASRVFQFVMRVGEPFNHGVI
jgi:hypothetical protein